MGNLGMEINDRFDPYEVLLLKQDAAAAFTLASIHPISSTELDY